MMKITNFIILLLFGLGRWGIAADRNPFEPPHVANTELLWQLKGTVVTNNQKFAFLAHPKLGDRTLQLRESLPQSNWWISEITSGTILLQQQQSSQTLRLYLTEPRQK